MHFISGMHRVKFHDENDMDRRGNNRESEDRYRIYASPSQSARKNIYSSILATTLRIMSYRSPSPHVFGFKTVMLVAKEKAMARPAIKNAPNDITIVCALDRYECYETPSQKIGRTDAESPGHSERIHPVYHT